MTEPDGTPGPTPTSVRTLDSVEAAELARLSSVYEDLQYVLRCCEHLVSALSTSTVDDALVEALWTGALVGYARCFSGQTKVLTDADLGELNLDADIQPTHAALKRLRETYASRHVNPREAFTVGAAQGPDGRVNGIAVTSTTTPAVDDQTVRLLGRIAYALSALLDARIQRVQQATLAAAAALTPDQLTRRPEVQLSTRP